MDSRVDRREGNERTLIPETRGVFQKGYDAIIIAHRRMEQSRDREGLVRRVSQEGCKERIRPATKTQLIRVT